MISDIRKKILRTKSKIHFNVIRIFMLKRIKSNLEGKISVAQYEEQWAKDFVRRNIL